MLLLIRSLRVIAGLVLLFGTLPNAALAAIQFDEVSAAAKLDFRGESYGASWGDFNGDNCPDLFSNHHRMSTILWENNCDGTFSNKYVAVFRNRPQADTHGGVFADFDNDGDEEYSHR